MPLEQSMIHNNNNNKRFHSNRTIAKGHISKMRCNFCGCNLTNDEEEHEDNFIKSEIRAPIIPFA